MSTSPVAYPPGSTAKTKTNFDQAKEATDDDSTDHRDRATAARLGSLESFMQAQQALQVSMQQQQQHQADLLRQQAIFMQQSLQQMGPTPTDKQTGTQNKQHDDKRTTQITQIKQNKQNKQKTEEEKREDHERQQLGVVSSSSSATAVGAWQDSCTVFVELEAANYLAQTDPNAYSCKDKKLTINHYTNFLCITFPSSPS